MGITRGSMVGMSPTFDQDNLKDPGLYAAKWVIVLIVGTHSIDSKNLNSQLLIL